ncbi:MAG: ankyrin repeat domain-containing protein [Blastocatellia bacterium]
MPKAKPKELIECLRSGDLAALKAIVHTDPEAARFPQVIAEAARLGRTRAIALLLKHGADLNASWRNYRPLHSLIQENPHADGGSTALERAELLKWMLDHGADPEQLGGWPATRAIITAAFVGEPAYVEQLRRAGAVVDGFVAAALGDIRRVDKAVSTDASFPTARDTGGLTALHCAAGSRLGARSKKIREGLLAIATLLLDGGADANARVRSWARDVDAVYFAVSSGQREIFALLLERGADATQALTPAVWRNDTPLAELALAHGGKLDRAVDEGKPLLNQMIRWGQFKQAMWMIERGASPNIADQQGWTAVHQAASRGNEKMLSALLESGGDMTRKNADGDTPLIVALSRGRPKIIALLDD